MQARSSSKCKSLCSGLLLALSCYLALQQSEARPTAQSRASAEQEAASAVIPSPNAALYGDELLDLQRRPSETQVAQASTNQHQASPVPVYVSQYIVPERFASQQESSHAAANFASLAPSAAELDTASLGISSKDLKVAESYGHGHHGSHGHHGAGKGGHYGGHGWLDMGAYTGKKGSFGWHANYPVGGKHHGHGYGK